MFIYSENREPFSGAIDFSRVNATKKYLDHYSNLLVLDRFANYGTMIERHQAEKEIKICKRKMKFWQRQANFDGQQAIKGREKLNAAWAETSPPS